MSLVKLIFFIRELLFVFFRGCTCLKCTIIVKCTILVNSTILFIGAAETAAPPEAVFVKIRAFCGMLFPARKFLCVLCILWKY